MKTDIATLTPSERNEQVVRGYFEARSGWTVTKLDLGKEKERATDFRICGCTCCFLCEVKTVESVRANFPFHPPDTYIEERQKQQNQIGQFVIENPGKQLVLLPSEWDFIYGDENKFMERYRARRRNTEEWFIEFAKTMKDYFAGSNISNLPYSLRLDSDDLYAPNPAEQETFFQWLEKEMRAIDRKMPDRHWQVENVQCGRTTLYLTSYRIHKPAYDNDVEAVYQLMVEGPRETGSLEVDVHSYGGLNLDAITRNLESGLEQLGCSASREPNQQIPRVIVLAFQSGIGFGWQELSSYVTCFLRSHTNLSAIAILDWIADGTPPPPENGFLAYIEFSIITPRVPSFCVYHNSWLQDIKPLPVEAFSDRWSVAGDTLWR